MGDRDDEYLLYRSTPYTGTYGGNIEVSHVVHSIGFSGARKTECVLNSGPYTNYVSNTYVRTYGETGFSSPIGVGGVASVISERRFIPRCSTSLAASLYKMGYRGPFFLSSSIINDGCRVITGTFSRN